MKNFKILIPIILGLILANSAFAQDRYFGKVTEIVDGRTVIVEPQPQVKIKIELQFIEVPEAEQQLHKLVKTHLSNMLLNKQVEFFPKNLNSETRPVGQVLLNGVDVSQQMLRDGAAWYAVLEKNLHNTNESIRYQNNETLAKNEKRGIWSIAELKPAWKFRAEKAEKIKQAKLKKKKEEKERKEKLRAEEKERLNARAVARRMAQAKANQKYKSTTESGLSIFSWQESSVKGMDKKPGYPNLLTKYIPQYQIEYTITKENFAPFKAGKSELRIEGRSIHLKKDNIPAHLQNAFGLGFLVSSEKGVFATSNDLTIYADKTAIKLGEAFRAAQKEGGLVKELLLYRINQDQLETISKAKNVKVTIGNYSGVEDSNYKKFIGELLDSTN